MDEISNLARSLSEHSTQDEKGNTVNPFFSKDSLLDPKSKDFSPRAWLEALVGVTSRDPDRYPNKTAGVAFRDLSAHGFGKVTDYQKTFGNYAFELLSLGKKIIGRQQVTRIQILRDFDGLVKKGQMLLVLGRPGSGCSTMLKTLAGETDGFHVSDGTCLNYQGVSPEIMHKDFRGECIYQAEVDVHFPSLTVSQTLEFAARARAPHNRLPGVSRDQYATHVCDVMMAVFGLTHAKDTIVGNDFIRGVSGGERKRVSIAEAAIAGSALQIYDNSTRGLDSATALEFVRTLRTSTDITGATAVVTLYQASEAIYKVFDKVTVLYQGRQIYFGDIHAAKSFFEKLGFECPPRQTTADFLTSLSSPEERLIRPGYENKVPRTPEEFAIVWQRSEEHSRLLQEIADFEKEYPIGGASLGAFTQSRRAMQATSQRSKSPYTLSIPMQIKLCMRRGFQRLQKDMTLLISGIISNSVLALVIGSMFYNLPDNTGSLYNRGSSLFFAILLAAFASGLEVLTLYAQRPIVEKHTRYAFYHPFAEAIASMIIDVPNKIGTGLFLNLVLYFMANLRRTPGHFFVFLLFTFMCTFTMSMYFRCIGALSRTFPQAMAPASVFTLAMSIYTGFSIPNKDMHPWLKWFSYVNPVSYAFEALLINEFHGRTIPCSQFVPEGPSYSNLAAEQRICATTGAAAGADVVDGDVYLDVNYQYHADHLWRNLGIMFALMTFGCFVYLVATEFISAKHSKGEVFLFRRNHLAAKVSKGDEEAHADDRANVETLISDQTKLSGPAKLQHQTDVLHWESVNYDIKVKDENKKTIQRRLLEDINGWVRPGTMTALMGVTGAGKTTLLDVLADRVTMGIISGEVLVSGRLRNTDYQRKTGYVQQQDLHLSTATVREALTFSAVLRQSDDIPHPEKIAYVDEVIKALDMELYADAVVGESGEGLNIEQRKRLTIGVELAAKPALLLFLDEPTSGLDSQTAWSIVSLLRKLSNQGQAILCTLHQPSAILFQEFDRLLFLAHGGKTLYFGDIGPSSKTFVSYFERNGARPCGSNENPAEWLLEITGAAGSQSALDWSTIWRSSTEYGAVKTQLATLKKMVSQGDMVSSNSNALQPFATSHSTQMKAVLVRVFQQYWRTPSYLYSKVSLGLFSSLFVGLSFWKTENSLQGLQNQLYAIFLLLTVLPSFCQQLMPQFVTQRTLYEARERPSKTYSWQVFILSNIIVEIPWNAFTAVLMFVAWYYPIGLNQNAIEAGQVAERGALMFLFLLAFTIFGGTLAQMVIAGLDTAEAAGNLATLMFSLSFVFCGVLATPDTFPRFWIFMYRLSPFTYIVSGVLSVGLANSHVVCDPEELLHFSPASSSTCSEYLGAYIADVGGYLTPESMNSTSTCAFCTRSDTNVFLENMNIEYGDRWRNFGILLGYIIFNITAAIGLYWLARVPKVKKEKLKKN